MGWRDTFHFDVDTYRQKTWTCSEYVLKKKHHVKVMRLYCTAAGVGTGIAAAPFTAGFTLCGATFSGRQHHILNEKRKIIEQEFINRMIPIPRYRTRDEVVGFGVGMASAGLGAVIPIGVDLITGEALNAAADASTTAAFAAVSHHVVSPQVIGHMASHAAHGIRDTVASGIRHLVGVFNGSGVAGGSYTGHDPTTAYGLGVDLAKVVEVEGIQRAVNNTLLYIGKEGVARRGRRP